MLQILQNIRQERVSLGLSQSEMAKILGVSQQVYSNIEAGKVKKLSADFVKNYENWSADTRNIVTEKEATYLQKRGELKNNHTNPDVPVFNGSTSLGNITMYSDENREIIGMLPQNVFHGCDYSEKACGDSMYPLIMNQAWLVGKKCSPAGITYGEKVIS